ncbi:putative uncharacterized ATP-dependent DEAD/DEAH box helicase [Desulfonema limicola]|uniref:Uncharacterized ATP-dependent DEAD/DEAH box helicase n=1 Tax=Desulfonema limicola TaxID=45656 RepID=A0A975BDU6_9BACT|nr:DEAD/DEAH box helicase [Desulfonema limicola]QTA83839.1 putative uncharacterized ATP-dependent DEAD/DEAH box helicase [Desulfonema limicola]
MLPATIAHDIKQQILHYLGATFNFRDPEVENELHRFFNDPENGIFKGPWLKLQLPFRQAGNDGSRFFDLKLPFTSPFRHQWEAWERLTAKNNTPQHTLITTGTGSGKTECFLFPILDYCLRMHEKGLNKGIKAVVLYPMNALAADQAGRFAREILTSEQLSQDTDIDGKTVRKARIRVGLYTGRMQPGQEDRSGDEKGTWKDVCIIPSAAPDGKPAYTAITSRTVMQETPPDILLTNYKMLDYLLMRPKDQGIWQYNNENRKLLQYLVLDELHTYDGAQGADVACLIRRLKERLDIPKGRLCVVGTSATIAKSNDETTDDPINRLCKFAETLFEESIPNDAVIQEDRCNVHEIIRPLTESKMPRADMCEPGEQETGLNFARRMAPLFGGPVFPLGNDDLWLKNIKGSIPHDPDKRWGLALGEWLRTQSLFHDLLKSAGSGAVLWNELVHHLTKNNFDLRAAGKYHERSTVFMAFLALVVHARELRAGNPFPLVPTQVQFWIRELRRIGRIAAPEPVFGWLDQPPLNQKILPTVHCTECGESAWVALEDPDVKSAIEKKAPNGFGLIGDPQTIYQGWGFDREASSRLVILSPWKKDDAVSGEQIEPEALRYYLSPSELVVRMGPGQCPISGGSTFPVQVVRESKRIEKNNQLVGIRRCPLCKAVDSLMFIGSRAATMASVAIDEMFGSVLNNDPKLLAFTDSVQDASHRAGFFSARTYHFTFRTALQHIIDDAGAKGLPITEAGERLVSFWSENRPGRPGSVREVMATLMPPDLREYAPYLDFRNNPQKLHPGTKLQTEFLERLNWEAASEYSLMLTHGRTMELHASACLGWDEAVIDETVKSIRSKLPGISPLLEKIPDRDLKLWIFGILYRQRERGGLYHPFLDHYASRNYWGKYPFGKTVSGRETHPHQGRYRPRLMVTVPDRYHDFILASGRTGQQAPWHLVWLRRVIEVPGVEESSLIDLIHTLLRQGTGSGLFKCLHIDGSKEFYVLNSNAARLYPAGIKLVCKHSSHTMFRPESEADLWSKAPSLSYYSEKGKYQTAELNDRERYYRNRYRKGALRRVFAYEHTGLLTTDERESLEMSFNTGNHADDPNVLTATSTLEMGIDIGDLSATMLCSIPPSTASFLQRIGRAGRRTGTALVLSIINQRPHDLFFFARPKDLLNGLVEPPGCWLDACAVLVRQYLAFCFDRAVKTGQLQGIPVTGRQLVDETIIKHAGFIPDLLEWMTGNEDELQKDFLARFSDDVQPDTVERFAIDSRTERLRERIETAAREFDIQQNLIRNASRRLKEQKKKADPQTEAEIIAEIEHEQRILKARQQKLGEISALEVLIEHGLLPNYAFPERGVRFSGATYNRHANKNFSSGKQKNRDGRTQTYELVRSGSSAIRELAPANRFYTHSHMFEIQQLEIGSKSEPLIEEWAVCGQCGHMRTVAEIKNPDALPYCPQCGYDGPDGQREKGQHRNFLPFHRSQAVSYMEYYESLSGDRGEERESEIYRLVTGFDNTVARAGGAVGNDSLPFGIEYREAVLMREINSGYNDLPAEMPFGRDVKVSDGFEICTDCGMTVFPGKYRTEVRHRRSCPGRLKTEKQRQKGSNEDAYNWQQVFLYREIRTEAIRLLLPDVEQADLDTLEACFYLGMRIHFQGDPAHLIVRPQIIPDHREGLIKHYLVLMDAVPGGTGFLKTLYQEKDEQNRPGEGVMKVLNLALNALETCECRRLHPTENDTDGCYRCIRTYHMQHRLENISRNRGIQLLKKLIKSGKQRTVRKALDEIKSISLFGSVLEKKFVDCLREWVNNKNGQWRDAMINGTKGFCFMLPEQTRAWELELQPVFGPHQNVFIPCQPDFLLSCDDPDVKPVAIFTDGFEPHVQPGEGKSRLADDIQKRRAILESRRYRVWNISWDDLEDNKEKSQLAFLQPPIIERVLQPEMKKIKKDGSCVPDSGNNIIATASNPWEQLKAFILCPNDEIWKQLACHAAGTFMYALVIQGIGTGSDAMQTVFEQWRNGTNVNPLQKGNTGDWFWLNRIALSEDMLAYALADDLISQSFDSIRIVLRLGDSQDERKQNRTYHIRWRGFMALMNFFQFTENFTIFTTSEVEAGTAPELPLTSCIRLSPEWEDVLEETVASLEPFVKKAAAANCAVPKVEYYSNDLDEELFAELAWPHIPQPIALLTGDQRNFAAKWQDAGWIVITDRGLQVQGYEYLIKQLPKI